MGNWIYSSTHLKPQHQMEVSGQIQVPAAYSPGKGPRILNG